MQQKYHIPNSRWGLTLLLIFAFFISAYVPSGQAANPERVGIEAPTAVPVINEFVRDHTGSDTNEYVEIYGTPNTDYSAYRVLQIEGDFSGAATGLVDRVEVIASTNSSGFWVTPFLNNVYENGTMTLLLVKDFSGTVGTDLDTNDDGVLDITPWSEITDAVALYDGGATDKTYAGAVVLTSAYDGLPFLPGGASRYPDGTDTDTTADWVRNNFYLVGISGYTGVTTVGEAYNTPGAPNQLVLPELVINEIDYDQPSTDTAEFVEIRNNGSFAVSLNGVILELVNGNGTSVYDTIALPNVSLAAGDYFVVCANVATTANCDLDDGPDTNFIQNGAPDAAGLRWKGILIDAVSYEGDTGAPYTEGSGTGLMDDGISLTQGISRCLDGTDTDQNNVDFVLTDISPGATNICPDDAPTVSSTTPVDGATGQSTQTNIDITFSENVTVTNPSSFTILGSSSGAHTYGLSGSDASYTLDPASDFSAGETVTVTVVANQVQDKDVTDPPDNMAADYKFIFTIALPGDAAPAVSSTTPADAATDVPVSANVVITFTESVTVSASSFTVTAETSGDHPFALSGSDASYTLDPASDFSPGEVVTVTVFAGEVADKDTDDPPDNMAADYIFNFTTYLDPCTLPYTHTYTIQGSGSSAAVTGIVTTQGVVVGDFETSAKASGFYLQDAAGDGDTTTSDGIFVYTGSSDLVSEGQVVRVTGYARERFNQTTLNGSNSNSSAVSAGNIVLCGTGILAATDVTMPFADATYLERFEGMYVRFPQELVISEYFNYDRFGEIVIALPLDGEPRPFTGTALDTPGAAANARTLANSLRRITLDDANSSQNPTVLRHPNGDPFSLTNLFRGGDKVKNTIGVLGYDFNLYRIVPTGPAEYTAMNPRPAAPEDVGGRLRIAAMNTLNFFVTLDPLDDSTSNDNPADNICGPTGYNHDCRGADLSQPSEFSRQRDKLIVALSGLDADIIGLNEIENTTGVEPLADIVSGLPGYAYIDTGTIGTDAIKVGLIYRTATVAPVGDYQILDTSDDPRFLDTRNRPALAQTFEDLSTGGRFTVVVNHFKSKGSVCDGDPDAGDGQGNCNGTRTLAAQALVDWLATDPTGSGDPDFIIMGDLNSYAMEDPITAIKAGPDDTAGTDDDYTNLISHFQGTYAYSYVFDGQFGYLDHALANANLFAQVTGAADWHINSDESDVLDYDTSFKPPEQEALYELNQYRTSDHDPVVVGLNIRAGTTTSLVSSSSSPVFGQTVTFTATVDVPSPGVGTADGTVEFYDGATLLGSGTLDGNGQATLSTANLSLGLQTIKAKYLGSTSYFASEQTTTVNVAYQEDFETPVGAEWCVTGRDTTPLGNRSFLGQFANQTVCLEFSGLGPHQGIQVSFDLYIIRTWNGSTGDGPDRWQFQVDGATWLDTTFSNWPGDLQAFPASFGNGLYDPYTGSSEQNTLGYTWGAMPMDAVYHFSFLIPHTATTLGLDFTALGLSGLDNESWGLDNVSVSLLPTLQQIFMPLVVR